MDNKRNLLFIILAGTAVYISGLRNLFVWDDILIIINNDFIKGYKLIKEVFFKPLFYFAGSDYSYYRPLQSLSNLCDYYIWGLNPLGFHLTNLLLHISAAVAIYFFITALFGDRKLSFVAALLFVVHPINASVVGYVASRSDILMTIFTISSLILFLKANSYKIYLLSLICFIFALLSKETAIIFPACLIFINEMYLRMNGARNRAGSLTARFWYFSFLIVPVAYILFRTQILGLKSNIMPPHKVDSLIILCTFLEMIYHYLRLIFFPLDLHMLRAIDIAQITGGRTIASLLIIIILAFIMLNLYRRNKIIFTASGLFLIWVSPVSSLAFRNLEYYFQQKAVMEEHWLYVPSIGIFIAISYFITKGVRYFGNTCYKAILLSVIMYFSIITINENRYWKDNYALFTHTNKYVKYSYTVYRNLAWVYINRNQPGKAIDMYNRALDLKQDDNQKKILYKSTAYAYFLNGQPDKAIGLCREAINMDFNYADAHAYLGLAYSENNLDSAVKEWKIALDKDQFNGVAFNNLLNLSKSDSNIRSYLIEKYKSSLGRYGNFESHKIYSALGIVYLYNGMNPEALLCLLKAREINPYDINTNNSLAVLYENSQDYEKAIKFFRAVLKLNPFDKQAYNNLSLLYSRLNRNEQARRLLEKRDSMNMYQ